MSIPSIRFLSYPYFISSFPARTLPDPDRVYLFEAGHDSAKSMNIDLYPLGFIMPNLSPGDPQGLSYNSDVGELLFEPILYGLDGLILPEIAAGIEKGQSG